MSPMKTVTRGHRCYERWSRAWDSRIGLQLAFFQIHEDLGRSERQLAKKPRARTRLFKAVSGKSGTVSCSWTSLRT